MAHRPFTRPSILVVGAGLVGVVAGPARAQRDSGHAAQGEQRIDDSPRAPASMQPTIAESGYPQSRTRSPTCRRAPSPSSRSMRSRGQASARSSPKKWRSIIRRDRRRKASRVLLALSPGQLPRAPRTAPAGSPLSSPGPGGLSRPGRVAAPRVGRRGLPFCRPPSAGGSAARG
jgi:hypothetical protein